MHNHGFIFSVGRGCELRVHRRVDLDITTNDREVKAMAVVTLVVDISHLVLHVPLIGAVKVRELCWPQGWLLHLQRWLCLKLTSERDLVSLELKWECFLHVLLEFVAIA